MPSYIKGEALDILCQAKPSFPHKRTALLNRGVPRTLIDEIELLLTPGCVDVFSRKVNKRIDILSREYNRRVRQPPVKNIPRLSTIVVAVSSGTRRLASACGHSGHQASGLDSTAESLSTAIQGWSDV